MDGSRNLRIYVDGVQRDSISLSDPSASQTSSLLAYRPNYDDYHDSGLAGLFVNIQEVFPCTAAINEYEPICTDFTREEDGFRKGNAWIDVGDIGNNINVFGGKSVWGVAVQTCPEFTPDCFPSYLQTEVVCMLPRSICE
jgi:hypothetical protein